MFSVCSKRERKFVLITNDVPYLSAQDWTENVQSEQHRPKPEPGADVKATLPAGEVKRKKREKKPRNPIDAQTRQGFGVQPTESARNSGVRTDR